MMARDGSPLRGRLFLGSSVVARRAATMKPPMPLAGVNRGQTAARPRDGSTSQGDPR